MQTSQAVSGDFEPVRRESTRDKVYAAIRDAIFSGKLRVGQRLTELKLTSEFQVSRSVVREALQQLAHEGLIELNSNRGAQVVDLTTDQVDQIVQLRLLLESEAVRQAKQRLTGDGKRLLETAARRLENARSDVQTFIRLDYEFHETLWKLTGNATLCRHLALLTRPLFSLGIIMRHRSAIPEEGATLRTPGDHVRLAETICEGTMDEAVDAIRRHITENYPRTRAGVSRLHEPPGKGVKTGGRRRGAGR